MLQARMHTQDGPGKFHAPHRDIANIGPDLIRAALHNLEFMRQEPWFKEFMAKHDVTEAQLGQGAYRLGTALCQLGATADEALEKAGFNALPSPAQAAIFIKLGQVFLAALYSGVKDITPAVNYPPPSIQRIVNDSCTVLQRMSCLQRGSMDVSD